MPTSRAWNNEPIFCAKCGNDTIYSGESIKSSHGYEIKYQVFRCENKDCNHNTNIMLEF
jgi:hypothetical protein